MPFSVYGVTIDKSHVPPNLFYNISRLYNYVARAVLENLGAHSSTMQDRVLLVVDKSKNKYEMRVFDEYISYHLEGLLSPDVSLDIQHQDSQINAGLQTCDMFCWGVFQSWEHEDKEWYREFMAEKLVRDKNLF